MRLPRKLRGSTILIVLGFIITVVAALLFGTTVIFSKSEQKKVENAAKIIEDMLPDRENGLIEDGVNSLFPNFVIDDCDYCGLLSYKDEKFAVLSSYDKLIFDVYPILYSGNPGAGDLIIYDGKGKQLAFADYCEVGEKITFTDGLGTVYNYSISAVKHTDKITDTYLESRKSDLRLVVKSSEGYLVVMADN